MLPGKQYKLEDYVGIVWRRKWLVIVPFVLVTAGTLIGTQFLRDRYRSDARILIVPQQVPENFVQPTVTTGLDARLQAISQQIQSRTRLERLIQELDLYPDERKTMIMEDVIERMRGDVSIQIPGGTRARREPGYFTVSYTSENARKAMQVTERLASEFISESLQDRTVQADQTTQFLETQLEDSRRRLIDHEQKLEQFRRKYTGQLPSQVGSNLQVMQSTQTQLQNVAEVINRDRDRQLVLDKTIADLMSMRRAPDQPSASRRNETPPATAGEQLEAARVGLRALMLRLKPEHPDVIRAQRVVRELEQKTAAEELNAPVGVDTAAVSAALPLADQKRLSEMQAERESLDRRIAGNRAEEARLQAVLSGYRARVEAAPTREAEEIELMRDYAGLQAQYATLLTRSQQSKVAADLERRQIGEQFKLIDPARVPERPISPDRPRLNLMGALAGLALGLVLIALLEYRDTTFRIDDDITVSLALPVIAVIPAMATRRERRTAKRRRLVAITASLAVMTMTLAVVAWKIDAIVRWVR